jgi:hypothetical protein
MDKEELMWRLAQGDATSDPARRSLSHSPTAAADQASHSVHSVSSAKCLPVPERHISSSNTPAAAGTSSAVSGVKLRRSGTYDLLNKTDADEVFD